MVQQLTEGMVRSLRKESSTLNAQTMHTALSAYVGKLSGPKADNVAVGEIISLVLVYTDGTLKTATDFIQNLLLSIGHAEPKLHAKDFRQEEYADTVGAILKYALIRNSKGIEILVQKQSESSGSELLEDMALAIGHRYGTFAQDFEKSICAKSKSARLLKTHTRNRWQSERERLYGIKYRFAQKRDDIHLLCQMLWDEIVTDARRDVRPDGYDTFTIDELDGSRKIFYRFIREGCGFPTVAVASVEEFACGARYEHSAFFNYESCPDGVSDIFDSDQSSARNLYFSCATLLAYHHILCRKVDVREPSESGEKNEDRTSQPGKLVPVCPHLRILQPGQKPGRSAYELAAEVLKRPLPAGYTFVRQHSFTRETAGGEGGETARCAAFNVNLSVILSWLEE